MFCENFLKGFCVVAMVGLVACYKFDATNFDTASFRKPIFKDSATPFWDNSFCHERPNMESFPHPDSCHQFLMCWENQLWELECHSDELFDPRTGFCDHSDNVQCIDYDPNPECPPRGSNEVRFLRGPQCNQFFRCFDGEPHLFSCHQGSHWNANLNFCDEPRFAGCTLS